MLVGATEQGESKRVCGFKCNLNLDDLFMHDGRDGLDARADTARHNQSGFKDS